MVELKIGQGWNDNNIGIDQYEHYGVLGNVIVIDRCGSQLQKQNKQTNREQR